MKKISTLLLAAAFGLMLAACSPSLDKQIVGKWQYAFSMNLDNQDNVAAPKMHFNCVDNIFPNKSSTMECNYEITGDTAGENGAAMKMAVGGTITVTQEWSIVDKVLYNKIIDAAVTVDSLSINGEKITDSNLLTQMKNDLSQDNPFIKGDTDKVKTISIDKNTWVFEIDMDGKPMQVTATRS